MKRKQQTNHQDELWLIVLETQEAVPAPMSSQSQPPPLHQPQPHPLPQQTSWNVLEPPFTTMTGETPPPPYSRFSTQALNDASSPYSPSTMELNYDDSLTELKLPNAFVGENSTDAMSDSENERLRSSKSNSPTKSGTKSPVNGKWMMKILRNCCGSSTATNNSPEHHNNNNNNSSNRQKFVALTERLDAHKQVPAFTKAIKRRLNPANTFTTAGNSPADQVNCILIKAGLIYGEEPFVIAWRLFLWASLREITQLKRIPTCRKDPVYVCCNPLHYHRILETETAPAYQHSNTDRLKTEDANLQNEKNFTTGSTGSSSISNYKAMVSEPQSLTTDGEGYDSDKSVWCSVAYWEKMQHIGGLFLVRKPELNIYTEGLCNDGLNDGICLPEVDAENRRSTPDIRHMWGKIGLGVTLCREIDGFWLYNRSGVSIFVHSPTVRESWQCPIRVKPGDCLRVFDSQRAQTIDYPPRDSSTPPGPVDKYCITISFEKSWGRNYKRQDVTLCPCWLQVFFARHNVR